MSKKLRTWKRWAIVNDCDKLETIRLTKRDALEDRFLWTCEITIIPVEVRELPQRKKVRRGRK